MPLPQNIDRKYTYKDYLTWPENERWEIIDGVPYMQAAPKWQHQSISRELLLQFGEYLKNKDCQIFSAPFDVLLPETDEKDEDATFVVQPDLVIVCDRNKLQGTGYSGAPSLIIEIMSPASNKMDRLYKFNKYERAGVKEYWIVEIEGKILSVFTLQENKRYGRPDLYSEEDKVKVSIFADLIVDLKAVFENV
jgi:Uma2 family endonuclease